MSPQHASLRETRPHRATGRKWTVGSEEVIIRLIGEGRAILSTKRHAREKGGAVVGLVRGRFVVFQNSGNALFRESR